MSDAKKDSDGRRWHRPGRPGDPTLAYYERNADAYVALTAERSMARFGGRLAAALRPGALVADLGCGSGRDLAMLAGFGLRPVGLDYSWALACRARARSGEPVALGDLRGLPFADAAFDAVWASASLHHLRQEELPAALAECRRVLKPHGLLFASVKHGRGAGPDALGRWFTYLDERRWRDLLSLAGFSLPEIVLDTPQLEGAAAVESVAQTKWLVTFTSAPAASS